MAQANELKVGDYVGVKYDVEQSGRVEKITRQYGESVYHVRVFEGGYVMNRHVGVVIEVAANEIW